MLHRKSVVSLAALAVLTTAGFACAGEAAVDNTNADQALRRTFLLDEPATAPAPAPTPDRPLMALLGMTPIGPALKKANINLYGFFEPGYTYSASAPPRN